MKMKEDLSDFLKIAYEYNKVRDLKEAFEEYPVEDEWHKGKIENVIKEAKENYNENYDVGDIVFVREYSYSDGRIGNNHFFVIIDQDNTAVPIENFGMLISSNLNKLKFTTNKLLEKDKMNNLHKDSIVKTDIVYKILNEQIIFKIGKVDNEKIEEYKKSFYNSLMKDIITLGIESSCDETSVAIVKNGREVLTNIINTQIEIHKQFGGVVPEIASRKHIENISEVTKQALKEANINFEDIDLVACTYGPGLVGALLVGVGYAKALSFALNKPLIGVNHIEGHIAANYITFKELEPPFLCLIISGGHTHLVYIEDYTQFKILGKTRDDAIGEAYDKVARVIGLEYPGGPKIDKLAKEGQENIKLPETYFDNLDFSFSGIKTAVLNLNHKEPNINKADLCASFEKATTDMLINNTTKAINEMKVNKIALAGGVSANSYIRERFKILGKELGIDIYYPELKLCTDNAAMIASAGYYNFIAGNVSGMELNAVPNLKIG